MCVVACLLKAGGTASAPPAATSSQGPDQSALTIGTQTAPPLRPSLVGTKQARNANANAGTEQTRKEERSEKDVCVSDGLCVRRFVCHVVGVSCGGGVMWWGCHGFVCVARATVWVISICLPGGPSHEGHGVVVRQTRPQHITVTVTVRIVVVAMVWKALTGR